MKKMILLSICVCVIVIFLIGCQQGVPEEEQDAAVAGKAIGIKECKEGDYSLAADKRTVKICRDGTWVIEPYSSGEEICELEPSCEDNTLLNVTPDCRIEKVNCPKLCTVTMQDGISMGICS